LGTLLRKELGSPALGAGPTSKWAICTAPRIGCGAIFSAHAAAGRLNLFGGITIATTVTPGTLTVTLTEKITLNGEIISTSNVQTVLLVTEVSKRIVEIPTSEIIVLAFAATNPGPGAFDEADPRYIRLRNLDDTNFIQLTFRDENSTEFAIKLDAGQFCIFGCDNAGGVVNTMIAAGSALTVPSTFADLVDITAVADTGAVDLEYFVAGV
jgi:hypothetical protein